MSSRILKDKQRKFVIIDAQLGRLLTPFEYRVYAQIKERAGDQGECWQSLEHMAEESGMCATTLKKALKGLMKRRILVKTARVGSTAIYEITEPTEWDTSPRRKTTTEHRRETSRGDHETPTPPGARRLPPQARDAYKLDPYELDPFELDQIKNKEHFCGSEQDQDQTPRPIEDDWLAALNVVGEPEETKTPPPPVTPPNVVESPELTIAPTYFNPVQAFEARMRAGSKPLNPWQRSTKHRDFNPEFVEFLRKRYLANTPGFKEREPERYQAEDWLAKAAFNPERLDQAIAQWERFKTAEPEVNISLLEGDLLWMTKRAKFGDDLPPEWASRTGVDRYFRMTIRQKVEYRDWLAERLNSHAA